jgi:hypothetical protein
MVKALFNELLSVLTVKEKVDSMNLNLSVAQLAKGLEKFWLKILVIIVVELDKLDKLKKLTTIYL